MNSVTTINPLAPVPPAAELDTVAAAPDPPPPYDVPLFPAVPPETICKTLIAPPPKNELPPDPEINIDAVVTEFPPGVPDV